MLKKASLLRSRYTTGIGIMVVAAAMLLVAGLSSLLIWNFYKSENNKEQLHWQVVLGLVADSRSKEVNDWLKNQFTTLNSLSENVSLKLYMTELTESDANPSVQPDYLNILLQVAADRSDFKPENQPEKMASNVEYARTAGIELLDINMRHIASTRYMPEIKGELEKFIKNTPATQKNFLDIFTSPDGKTRMVAFLVPVFSVQGDRKKEDQLGYIVGVTEVGSNIFSRLLQPGIPYSGYQTLLVRKVGNLIEYISPLPGTPGTLRLDAGTRNLDSSWLFENGGGFAVKENYQKKEALAFGRKLETAPWMLIHEIEAETAFKEGRARTKSTISILILITSLMLAVLFAVWRHASSLRSETAANEFKEIARRHNRQETLLRLITDSQPDAMFILDNEGFYRFANLKAAAKFNMNSAQVIGKSIQDMLGRNKAERYLDNSKKAFQKMGIVSHLSRKKEDTGLEVLQVKYVPLIEIPDPYSSETRKGTLVLEHDITEEILQKEKGERILRSLVTTLTSVMDKRIPFSDNHSARVSKLSKIIAREMGLDRTMEKTVEFAGKLMNLGKIFVPEALLTREGPLDQSEINKVRQCVQISADLVKDIEFAGPVMETIRQSQEKLDGSGVLGLKGDEIILPAKIICVANTFVGMTSSRAYRSGMNVDDAMKILMGGSGEIYERSVVVALGNYIDNRSEDNSWLVNSTI